MAYLNNKLKAILVRKKKFFFPSAPDIYQKQYWLLTESLVGLIISDNVTFLDMSTSYVQQPMCKIYAFIKTHSKKHSQ